MTFEEKVEILAELQHKKWKEWASSIINTIDVPYTRRKNWESWMCEYSELPEHIKKYTYQNWAKEALLKLGYKEEN